MLEVPPIVIQWISPHIQGYFSQMILLLILVQSGDLSRQVLVNVITFAYAG